MEISVNEKVIENFCHFKPYFWNFQWYIKPQRFTS